MIVKKDKNKKDNEDKKEKTNALKKALAPKLKKEKTPKPKKYVSRKIGAVTFWVLFGFMFLVLFSSITSNSSANDEKEEEIRAEVNPATKPEAIQFARSFVTDYFTWETGTEGFNDREERLSKYLAVGIDAQAGLSTNDLKWDASFNELTIKRIDETGENKAHIVFEVSSKWTREVEKEVEVDNGKKGDKKETKTEIQTDTETKNVKKHFAVPILFNGETYGVYELPYFTYVEDDTNVKMDTRKSTKLSRIESKEKKNIESFLNTFFASYAEDSKDKLSYILSDKEHPTGLNGTMVFKDVKDTEVYKGKDNSHFLVFTRVTFELPDIETAFNTSYELEVKKEDNHYVVTRLNAEAIFDELTEYNPTEQVSNNSNTEDESDEDGEAQVKGDDDEMEGDN